MAEKDGDKRLNNRLYAIISLCYNVLICRAVSISTQEARNGAGLNINVAANFDNYLN